MKAIEKYANWRMDGNSSHIVITDLDVSDGSLKGVELLCEMIATDVEHHLVDKTAVNSPECNYVRLTKTPKGMAYLSRASRKESNVSDEAIEKEINEKGLNAPRLSPQHIESVVADEKYIRVDGTTLTICVLTLKNGFHVVAESAAASPENFDEEIGRKVARSNAINKIWPLEGYLLRDKLNRG